MISINGGRGEFPPAPFVFNDPGSTHQLSPVYIQLLRNKNTKSGNDFLIAVTPVVGLFKKSRNEKSEGWKQVKD